MRKLLLTAAVLLLSIFHVQAQPPKVPQSITFAGQKIDFSRSDLYERMDRELLAFTYMHSSSMLMLKRADRVFREVVPILRAKGVPEDLKYLMAIESNLDPRALSGAGAAGLWQFMTASGREYGLEVNSNVDERYNIEKSTIAACRYLKESYARYGDWMSVAASYNAGPNGISRKLEVEDVDSALDLWLNTETSRYMFRVLACKMFFENPAAFGFSFSPSDSYRAVPIRETVTVTDEIPDLVAFAKEHGVSYAQLRRANLWLKETKLNNASHRTYKIRIPKE